MKSKPNWHIVTRYKHRSWYMGIILFFILVGVALYFTQDKVISPCQEVCHVDVVMLKETKPELQEIVDYILTVFAPSGRQAQVKALACFISESGLRKDAVSLTNDHGIAQINLTYHRLVDPYNYKANIDMAYQIYKNRGWDAWYGKGCK